ncbi:MAG: hypothetical protein AVDCRST_MAG11-1920, partial [uncultured Gemmatimonadaceae bacterium]
CRSSRPPAPRSLRRSPSCSPPAPGATPTSARPPGPA